MNSARAGSDGASQAAGDLCAEVRGIAAARGDWPFLIDVASGRHVSYAEHAAAATRLARALRAAGVAHGDRVLVALPNSVELATLYFAALFLGATVVPVNLQLHPREVEFIVRHAGAAIAVRGALHGGAAHAVLTDALLDELGLPAFDLSGDSLSPRGGGAAGRPADAGADDWRPFDGVGPDDLFSITFTSGTTSLPKAVPHRIGALLGSAKAFNQLVGLSQGTRMLHVLNMAYMAGFLNALLCPYMAGGTVVIAPQFDAASVFRFWGAVRDHAVNSLWVSPTILESLLRLDRDPAGAQTCRDFVNTICVGTAPLSNRTKREFEAKYGVTLLESYGLSELLFIASNARGAPQQEGSVGQLLEGVRLRTVGDAGDVLGPGDTGELSVRTPFLMVGYLNYDTGRPDPVDRDSWFDTGDVGRIAPDGSVFITGRKKDIIIRGGVNISPRVIEEALLEHPAVSDVAVVGVPHTFYGEEVAAVVVTVDGRPLDELRESLLGHARSRLAASAVPTRWVALDALPKSTIGKVQKHKLREALAAT